MSGRDGGTGDRSKAERRMIRVMTKKGGKGFRILRSAETNMKHYSRHPTSDADPASTSASEVGWMRTSPDVEAMLEDERLDLLLSEFYHSDDGDYVSALGDLHKHVAAREAAAEARGRAEGLREVWHVTAHGGRSVDRVCDSLETGKSVCDDLLAQLGGEFDVIEDWSNHNVESAPPRWVRYISRKGSEFEQSVGAVRIDTSGTWFRENAPAYRADSLAAPRGDGEGK